MDITQVNQELTMSVLQETLRKIQEACCEFNFGEILQTIEKTDDQCIEITFDDIVAQSKV